MKNNQKIKSIPFTIKGSHLILVPVEVEGIKANFIFDTGIGVSIVSKKLCEKISCKSLDNYSGKRMSGQELKLDIVN